jgi:CRP/FNR family cyclic AMP-dependent transcriptional regulator
MGWRRRIPAGDGTETEGTSVDRTLIAVIEGGCAECERTMAIVEQIRRDNASSGLDVARIDIWEEERRVRELGVMEHPTLVVVTNGRERVRLSGRVTHRQILRKLLPQLYPERAAALSALRRQLDSPAEEFPGRRSGFPTRRLAEKVERLRGVELFSDLSTRQIRAIARVADEMPVGDGQILVTEGDRGETCFVVLEGTCVVRRGGRRLEEIGPGACVGEMALIDDEPRSATVVASSDMELLVIERADFDLLLAEVGGLARAVMVQLARRLRAADRKLVG